MRAAGVIEFTLAFALLWTPLVRRFAAIILTGMFISAVFEFGKVDAIGHSLIIVVLLAIAADNRACGGGRIWWRPLLGAPSATASPLPIPVRLLRGARLLFGTTS